VGSSDRAVRVGMSLVYVLVIAVVSLSVLAAALYFRLGDSLSRLEGCQKVLSECKSEVRSLSLYTENLYSNYTVVYRFAESLAANCSKLAEGYSSLRRSYEDLLSSLSNCRKLYEETETARRDLESKYLNATRQLEVVGELQALAARLRAIYLHTQVLSAVIDDGTRVHLLSNLTIGVRKAAEGDWVVTGLSSPITITTPDPGILIINYSNTQGVCFIVRISNTYTAMDGHIYDYAYFNYRSCSPQGEIVVPVLPHATVLKLELPWWALCINVKAVYLVLDVGELPDSRSGSAISRGPIG